jgi:hypothetical protein
MARTVEEIQAELESVRAAGEHHMSARCRALRAELRELTGVSPEKAGADDDSVTEPAPVPAPTETVPAKVCLHAHAPEDPYASPEWAFLERACAEVELQHHGNQSDIVKKFYQELQAKVLVWRMAREIVQEVGIGNDWPQWGALGRNPSTGKKDPKFAPRPQPEPTPEPAMPPVTDAGMPIRSRQPSKRDIIAAVVGGDPRAGVMEDLSARPESVRKPQVVSP